jgi:uncharacterized protein YfdQ (DUF2303 family)
MTDDIQAALDAGQVLGDPDYFSPTSKDIIAFRTRPGEGVGFVSPERYAPHPWTRRGTARLDSHGALAAYLARYATSSTALWVDAASAAFTAVIDGHRDVQAGVTGTVDDGAGWGSHQAVWEPKLTVGWKRWTDKDGAKLSQGAFAALIDSGSEEITDNDGKGPSAADLVTIAETLRVTTRSDLTSVEPLDGGSTLMSYTKAQNTRAGRSGTVEIPNAFYVLVYPYKLPDLTEDERAALPAFAVRARLSVVVETGMPPAFRFELINLDRVLEAAFEGIYAMLRGRLDALAHVNGAVNPEVLPLFRGSWRGEGGAYDPTRPVILTSGGSC